MTDGETARRPLPVLVVDDDPAIRFLYSSALEAAGITTIEAGDGADALALLEHLAVSVVVLDHELPTVNGAELLRRLRETPETRTLPVIMVTGLGALDRLVCDLESAPDDYLTKPVNIDELIARVRAQHRKHDPSTEIIEPLRRRVAATELLAGLDTGGSIEELAAAVCNVLIEETGEQSAGLYVFASPLHAVQLAGTGATGDAAVPTATSCDPVISSYLFDRAREGPWSGQAAGHPFDGAGPPTAAPSVADRAFLVAPIVRDDHPIGLLFLGGSPGAAPLTLSTRHLATLLDFAGVSGMLLGAAFLAVSNDESRRTRLRQRYQGRRFATHFQPVIDLVTFETVGHEALTRWDDGARADLPFAAARRIGLSLEIEEATLRNALMASQDLPGDTWVAVNLSPDVIIDLKSLEEILTMTDVPVVLEITEHHAIENYDSLRLRIEGLGDAVRIAIDDAGAGYATLQHVLALEPTYVKLDISWIRGIDADRSRQAMVAGMVHFAYETGRELIAEGVETLEELATVRKLGVQLGQGYLFSRPAPAIQLATCAAETVRAFAPA